MCIRDRDKDRMHDFARASKAHGLLYCPIRDKMDPDHIEICLLYTSRCV